MRELIIAGGGFAGLWAAMSAAAERHRLAKSGGELAIRLISDRPDMVVRPRLYEGAKAEICVSLLPILEVIGVDFEISHVDRIDAAAHRVSLEGPDAGERTYDRLVVATGSRLRPLPVTGADQYGFDADTFEAAARLDARLATLPSAPGVAVVGAGFTGLEIVTELRDRLGPEARLMLLDQAPVPGHELGPNLQPVLRDALAVSEVETHLGVTIVEIDARGIVLASGSRLDADMVVITTGLEASPLVNDLAGRRDGAGRVFVDQCLRLPDQPHVFLAGDTARALTDGTHMTLMCCQHALQLGRYEGANALRDMLGEPLSPYRQERYVTCLDLGPAGAVFTTGWDREVQKTGKEAKTVKQQIMRERIYPPDPSRGAEHIFREIGLDDDA